MAIAVGLFELVVWIHWEKSKPRQDRISEQEHLINEAELFFAMSSPNSWQLPNHIKHA